MNKIIKQSGQANLAESFSPEEVIPVEEANRRKKDGWLFKHSAHDFWLVLLAFWNIGVFVGTAVFFDQLSVWALLGIGAYLAYMNCHNYQCIAHNFIHNPFFKAKWLNHAFSVVNSLAVAMTQTLFRMHHLNHHKYNNDYQDPQTGETRDYSSIFRFSKKAQEPESLITYSLLTPLRIDFLFLYRIADKKGLGWLVKLETAALLIFFGILAWINWQFFVFFFLPVVYLGNVVSQAENYFEHFGGEPTSRLTDSVSAYGRFYNWFWFRNGFHQEHHFKPYVHWTRLHEVRADMLPDNQRQVVGGSHFRNFWNVVRGNSMQKRAALKSKLEH